MGTRFTEVYNSFLGRITDDLYLELTPADTIKDLQNLLINAIPLFEFPRVVLTDYQIEVVRKRQDEVLPNEIVTGYVWNELEEDDIPDEGGEQLVIVDNSEFTATLSSEEIAILAILMMDGWLQRQISSIEITRMKYSGVDFKLTSQANHLNKLLALKSEIVRQSHHLQRLYKRRKIDDEGNVSSNWGVLNYHTKDARNKKYGN